jgi:hypothetical protein
MKAHAKLEKCCGVDDYSVDNRGDVGFWVCDATMDGLEIRPKRSIFSE